MLFFVELTTMYTIAGDVAQRYRPKIAMQIQKITTSGKVVAGGGFTGTRNGFFVLDLDASEEVYGLLGNALLDTSHVRVLAVTPFDKMEDVFRALAQEGA